MLSLIHGRTNLYILRNHFGWSLYAIAFITLRMLMLWKGQLKLETEAGYSFLDSNSCRRLMSKCAPRIDDKGRCACEEPPLGGQNQGIWRIRIIMGDSEILKILWTNLRSTCGLQAFLLLFAFFWVKLFETSGNEIQRSLGSSHTVSFWIHYNRMSKRVGSSTVHNLWNKMCDI